PMNIAEGVTAPGGIDYGVTDGIATLGPPNGAPLEYRLEILGVNDGQPMVSVASVAASELFFGGTVAIGSSKITASDEDNPPASQLTISVSAADGSISPASLTYQQLLSGSSFMYTHSGDFPIDLTDQVSVTVSDGTLTSSPSIMTVNARVSFANNVGRIIDDPSDPNDRTGVFPHLDDDCASCHNSSNPYPTAPPFLNADETAASWEQARSRVVLPENACVSPNSPSSPLLTQ